MYSHEAKPRCRQWVSGLQRCRAQFFFAEFRRNNIIKNEYFFAEYISDECIGDIWEFADVPCRRDMKGYEKL